MALVLWAVAGIACAKDLGVLGTTWPITEVDVRQLLVEDAARANWSATQGQIKDGAKRYLDDLPKRHLESAPTTQTLWVDPSVILSSDIQAPVQDASGAYQWRVLATKGTRVNPLLQFRPVTAFLMFDGSDERQIELVRKVLAKESTRVIPVEAGSGNLNRDNEALKRGVYFASDAMVARFQVRYLPSLVYPGTGSHELFLGVTSFALPFSSDAVLQAWPSLGFSTESAPLKGVAP